MIQLDILQDVRKRGLYERAIKGSKRKLLPRHEKEPLLLPPPLQKKTKKRTKKVMALRRPYKSLRRTPSIRVTISWRENTALKIILEKDFPKLIGPSNFEEWHRAFKRAMVLSNYWGLFSEDYNDASVTTWHKLDKQKAVEFIKKSCSKDKELEIIDAQDLRSCL